MLYFGLVVGAILGIFMSIIFLALAKEFVVKSKFGKNNIVNQADQQASPAFFAMFSANKKDKLFSKIG